MKDCRELSEWRGARPVRTACRVVAAPYPAYGLDAVCVPGKA